MIKLDRTIYDEVEKEQREFLVNLLHKSDNESDRKFITDILRVVMDSYMDKRNVIDCFNQTLKTRRKSDYNEM